MTNTSHAAGPHVTFASLPQIERRKRRSASVKLGVAGRSSLMRQRRPALENINNGGLPRERHRDLEEEWGGGLRKGPPGSEMWPDEEMEYPKIKPRSEQQRSDSEVALLAMGRLVKSAWRRVSQTQMRIPPSSSPGGSVGCGLEKALNTPNKLSSAQERTLALDLKSRRSDESVNEKQSPPTEDDTLGAAGNESIHLKFTKQVLVRSASEPHRKMTNGVR